MPDHVSASEHLSFLRAVPAADPGFHMAVYADRLDDAGQTAAAHVLRHRDAALAHRDAVLHLHRSVCAEIERVFGCRHTPRRRVSDDPEPRPHPAHPGRLFVRKSSFLCFTNWSPAPNTRGPYYRLLQRLDAFERRVRSAVPGSRELIVTGRPVLYEVSVLPLLHGDLTRRPAYESDTGE